ncbi:MAG: hypothetical protein AAF617_12245, partial [Bacteroidota bacterium]
MQEGNIFNLTTAILKNLSVEDIVYAEIAESGAMGNAGGIIVYAIKNELLCRYETSLFENETAYVEAQNLLLKHQNGLKVDTVELEEILFDYHYGGMGNHVLVNKKIFLRDRENHFILNMNDKKY